MRPRFKDTDPFRGGLTMWMLNEYGKALTAKQRQVLEFRYGIGDHWPMTFDDIGQRLGIAAGTAWNIWDSASRNLLRILTKKHNPHMRK